MASLSQKMGKNFVSENMIANRLRHITNDMMEMSHDLQALGIPDMPEKLRNMADILDKKADSHRRVAKNSFMGIYIVRAKK
jgi:hypothetical protein